MISKVSPVVRVAVMVATAIMMAGAPLSVEAHNLRNAAKDASRKLEPKCDTPSDVCVPWATCVEDDSAYRGYLCDCPEGSTGNGFPSNYNVDVSGAKGNGCEDIDECLQDPWPCPLVGAFCVDHDPLPDGDPFERYECGCHKGYTVTGTDAHGATGCEDINECEVGTATCDTNADCVNLPGGHECVCKTGYQFDAELNTCTEIPEAIVGNPCDQCDDETEECSNTLDYCICKVGYFAPAGRGGTCQKVFSDPCESGGDCDENAKCDVIPAGNICTCNPGFEGGGKQCADINECARSELNDCPGNSVCVNCVGLTCAGKGYYCDAAAGFESISDGEFGDINECADGSSCYCDVTVNTGCNAATGIAQCTNNVGSFTCACPPGYREESGLVCRDINECLTGPFPCAAGQRCDNCIGLTCPNGLGYQCISPDADECAAGVDNCDENAICTNEFFGFSCACKVGYKDESPTGQVGTVCTLIPAICGSTTDPDNQDCQNDGNMIGYEGYDYATIDFTKFCYDGSQFLEFGDGTACNSGGPYAVPSGWELVTTEDLFVTSGDINNFNFGSRGLYVVKPPAGAAFVDDEPVTGVELCGKALSTTCAASGACTDGIYEDRENDSLGTYPDNLQTPGCDEVILIRRTPRQTPEEPATCQD